MKPQGEKEIDLYEILPGILLSTLAIVLTSLADRPPSVRVRALFDEVGSRLTDTRIN